MNSRRSVSVLCPQAELNRALRPRGSAGMDGDAVAGQRDRTGSPHRRWPAWIPSPQAATAPTKARISWCVGGWPADSSHFLRKTNVFSRWCFCAPVTGAASPGERKRLRDMHPPPRGAVGVAQPAATHSSVYSTSTHSSNRHRTSAPASIYVAAHKAQAAMSELVMCLHYLGCSGVGGLP